MCDSSNFVVGAVSRQRLDKKSMVIYYDSKTLVDTKVNYFAIDKELLPIVLQLENFRSYS